MSETDARVAATSEAGWKWYGYAGHFIGGKSCAFHLATRVPGYLISTVGDYRPNGYADKAAVPIGAGETAMFETYVFECEGEDENGNPNVLDWGEIDGERYADSLSAERTHYAYCRKYAALAAAQQEDGK